MIPIPTVLLIDHPPGLQDFMTGRLLSNRYKSREKNFKPCRTPRNMYNRDEYQRAIMRYDFMDGKVVYFEKRGKQNTEATLRLARARAEELGIKQAVIASTNGYTALKASEVFRGSGIEIVAVSISTAFENEGWTMSPKERQKVEQAGVRVLTTIHGLADGVAEGLYGEYTPGSVIANTLRMLSQGMKVAVEVSVMALEAGVVPIGREIIAVGGTDEGCDTAIVVRPAHARKIKEFKICEVLCKPRLP
jgi:hypothetical protein